MDVGAWLRGLGLGQYEPAFRDNEVDAGVLPRLTAEDLKDLGVTLVGHRRRLLDAIDALRADGGAPPPRSADPDAAPSPATAPAGKAERRQLTVMFVDLVGSTALSGRLDPEDMREVLRTYQNTVTGEIARVDGHVAKLMGDGVLAYFGWPRADEDEDERAVRAGLAIVEAVGRLASPAGEPLAARVGIATGLVVVGDLVGEGAAREEAVIGETPNLAARLQEAAPPGAVVIAAGTRRLLGAMFELRELAPTRLKGFAHPVGGFLVLGERLSGSRFEARRSGRPPPMVGRDQEQELVLERWRRAAAGEGQAVLLVGEAGIGKSRLVQAVLEAVAAGDHVALRYQCSPHHTGTALWPIARQLGLAAGFETADAEAARLDKLEALLRRGAEDLSEAAPLVAALLGIDAGGRYAVPDLSPQRRRARTLAVLVEQFLGLARRRPVLMVLEDAHWIDPTTLELVGRVLDRIAGAGALMLLTSRPDNQPSLGGHPHMTRLTLNRLGRGPTEAIVAGLAGGRNLPSEVLDEIAARTDGVPLFIEELTKAVLEACGGEAATLTLGAVTPATLAVPATLHASLLARLDRLGPTAREVAQVGAAVGREFSHELLAALSGLDEAGLAAALDRLAGAGLVFRRGAGAEAGYLFKHALVRDAAYGTLLRDRRRQLHATIARVLEQGPTGPAPELIAHHLTEAGEAERAVRCWLEAGRRSAARSAHAEAAHHLRRGLEVLATLPASVERDRAELELQLGRGTSLTSAAGYTSPEVREAFERARTLGEALGDGERLAVALYGLYSHLVVYGEYRAAFRVAGQCRSLAERSGDPVRRLLGHRALGTAAMQLGSFREARQELEAAIALYDPDRDRSLANLCATDPRASGLGFLSLVLWVLGFPEQARRAGGEAIRHAETLGHPSTTSHARLHGGAQLAVLLRDSLTVEAEAEAIIATAAEYRPATWRGSAIILRGWARAMAGDAGEGRDLVRQGMAVVDVIGTRFHRPHYIALWAEVHGRLGELPVALRLSGEAQDEARRFGEEFWRADLHRIEGELRQLAGRPAAEVEACYDAALATATRQGAKSFELRAALSLARLWAKQGDSRKAHDLLAPVYGWFTEGLDTPDLVEAKELLDDLASAPQAFGGTAQRHVS